VTEPRPLFVDTNAFVAIYDESDDHHERANAVLDGIRDRSYPYGPLFTSRHVLSETATVLLYGSSHRDAVRALRNICESSSMNVLASPSHCSSAQPDSSSSTTTSRYHSSTI